MNKIDEIKNSKHPYSVEMSKIIMILDFGLIFMSVASVALGFIVSLVASIGLAKLADSYTHNVADIFITGGCILLFAHLILFNKAFWKDDKK